MYRCGKCNKVVPKKRPRLVVTEYRLHQHPFRAKVYDFGNGRFKDDPGGIGKQISKETPVCFRCHEDYKASAQKEQTEAA